MKSTPQKIAILISALLLWAILPLNPYGYYQFLRVIVFCYIGYLLSIKFFNNKADSMCWMAIGIGITYNPIFKLHLGRPLWSIVNIATAVVLLWITQNKTKQT